jgi:hypothetical protein
MASTFLHEDKPQSPDERAGDRPPRALWLFSLVTIWANSVNRSGGFIHPRTVAWYAKSEVTFSDAITAVRRVLWCPPDLSMSRHNRGYMQIPTALLRRLTDTLCYAA